MSLFKKWFGPKQRLGEESSTKKKKPKGRWEKPANALEKSQLNPEQLEAIPFMEAFIQMVCESKGWNYEDFEGPFIIPTDEGYEAFIQQIKEEESKGPDFKMWVFECGNANGDLRGLCDNEGNCRLVSDGYYG